MAEQQKQPEQGKQEPKKSTKGSIELVVDGTSIVKLQVPPDFDIKKTWEEFKKAHADVTDKKGAFPTSFVGDLVNKHKCVQIDGREEAEKVELRI